MKRMIKGVFVLIGMISLGLGVVGIILPILPTTPFLLLSAACFAKGSENFHKWFTSTKLYKKYIEQPIKKKNMTAKEKRTLLCTVSVLLLIGFVLSPIWHAKVLIAIIALGHFYYFIFKIKTISESQRQTELHLPSGEKI